MFARAHVLRETHHQRDNSEGPSHSPSRHFAFRSFNSRGSRSCRSAKLSRPKSTAPPFQFHFRTSLISALISLHFRLDTQLGERVMGDAAAGRDGPGIGPFVGGWTADGSSRLTIEVAPSGDVELRWPPSSEFAAPPKPIAATKVDVKHGDPSVLSITSSTPENVACFFELRLTVDADGAAALEGSFRRLADALGTVIRLVRSGHPTLSTAPADKPAPGFSYAAAASKQCEVEDTHRDDAAVLSQCWDQFTGVWKDRTRAIEIVEGAVHWKGSTVMPASSISVGSPILDPSAPLVQCVVTFPQGYATWTFTVGARGEDGSVTKLQAHAKNGHGFEGTFMLSRASPFEPLPMYHRPETMMMMMLVLTYGLIHPLLRILITTLSASHPFVPRDEDLIPVTSCLEGLGNGTLTCGHQHAPHSICSRGIKCERFSKRSISVVSILTSKTGCHSRTAHTTSTL